MRRRRTAFGQLLGAGLAWLVLASPALAIDGSETAAPPGALSCSGCHGARPREGALLPPITGRPAAEITAALAAFRSGERASTVMGRVAKGFSPDEDRAVAAWLETRK